MSGDKPPQCPCTLGVVYTSASKLPAGGGVWPPAPPPQAAPLPSFVIPLRLGINSAASVSDLRAPLVVLFSLLTASPRGRGRLLDRRGVARSHAVAITVPR